MVCCLPLIDYLSDVVKLLNPIDENDTFQQVFLRSIRLKNELGKSFYKDIACLLVTLAGGNVEALACVLD